MCLKLRDLAERLKQADPEQVVKVGLTKPHSYRAHPEDVAFEPTPNVTVEEMLEAVESAIGETFVSPFGGEHKMKPSTHVWIARPNCRGESLGPLLLDYMLDCVGEQKWTC